MMFAMLDYQWGMLIGMVFGLVLSAFVWFPVVMGLSNVPKDLKDLNETLKADNDWLRIRLKSIYDKGFRDGFKNGIKSEVIRVTNIALEEAKNDIPQAT